MSRDNPLTKQAMRESFARCEFDLDTGIAPTSVMETIYARARLIAENRGRPDVAHIFALGIVCSAVSIAAEDITGVDPYKLHDRIREWAP